MTRVKLSAHITDLSGSTSGTTFQRGLSGTIMRNRPNPVNKDTLSQQSLRSINKIIYLSWQSQSPSFRQTFNTFAQFLQVPQKNNTSKILSGYSLFYKINSKRFMMGIETLNPPVFSNAVPMVASGTVSGYGTNLFLNSIPGYDQTLYFPFLKITCPVNETNNNINSKLRFVKVDNTGGSPISIYTNYRNTFGFDVPQNAIVWYDLVFISLSSGVESINFRGKVDTN
jgi:hypothetical protein